MFVKAKSLFWTIIAGACALILANFLVPGFEVQGELTHSLQILFLAGVFLGLINFFIKPILNLLTLPLRWLTFGLFGLAVNLFIVWLVDIVFSPEISIIGFRALFITSLLVWLSGLLTPKSFRRKKRRNN